MMSIGVSSIAILNIYGVGYCCTDVEITESEAISLLRNTNLSETSGLLWTIKKIFIMYQRWIKKLQCLEILNLKISLSSKFNLREWYGYWENNNI